MSKHRKTLLRQYVHLSHRDRSNGFSVATWNKRSLVDSGDIRVCRKALQKDTNGVTLKSSNSVDRKLDLMIKEFKNLEFQSLEFKRLNSLTRMPGVRLDVLSCTLEE